MAAVQDEDVRASSLSAGYLNGHHQVWLGSTTSNRRGGTTIDFATVSGCDQLVVGETLDLLMTDVQDLNGLLL